MISFLKKDELLPLASRDNPDLKEIFQICAGNVNENLICKKRPYRVRETATFIINQNTTKVVHHFDLQTDDLGVKMALTENVRFYEYEIIDNSPNLSHEVTVRKEEQGRVINGTYKERHGKIWCEVEAMPEKLYAVFRRRASFSDHCGSLTRYVTFIMALDEYNHHKNNLTEKKPYLLHHPYIIVNYTLHGSLETESKACYWKTQLSTRKSIEEVIIDNPNEKPRLIQDAFERESNIFERESDSTLPQNRKQILNHH